MKLEKVKDIQSRGRKVLVKLSEKDRDDANKLLKIQQQYLLDPYDDIWEYASERISNIISAGRRYVGYEEWDILEMIAEEDECLEFRKIKDVYTLQEILGIYYDVPSKDVDSLIEEVDEAEKQANSIVPNSLALSLVEEIKKNLTDKKEVLVDIKTKEKSDNKQDKKDKQTHKEEPTF